MLQLLMQTQITLPMVSVLTSMLSLLHRLTSRNWFWDTELQVQHFLIQTSGLTLTSQISAFNSSQIHKLRLEKHTVFSSQAQGLASQYGVIKKGH